MNRNTEADLKRAGYHLADVERYQNFAPGLPSFPGRYIRALPPGSEAGRV